MLVLIVPFRTIVATLLFVCLFSCTIKQGNKEKNDEEQIRRVLDSTALGWNSGNLAMYLFAYRSDATEMLSTGPAGGVEVIEETMKAGFWKNGRPEQLLKYDNVVVRFLSKGSALVTGRYNLSGAGKPDRRGWFTTIWVKTKVGWRMVHDHS